MKSIWIITKRELSSYFDSLTAYVLITIFLLIVGYLTWLNHFRNIFLYNQADLRVFFQWSSDVLFVFVAAITMRSIAEENKTGTIELLSTKAISDWQIVVGKFLSSFLLVAIAFVCTVPYYATVAYLGDVDHGGIIGAYIGLLFLTAAYVSIGIFASSITNNQIVAFLIALAIGIMLQFVIGAIGESFRGSIGAVFDYLSTRTHYMSLSRGVFDLRDISYFLSLTFIGLVLSTVMLSRRNWQK